MQEKQYYYKEENDHTSILTLLLASANCAEPAPESVPADALADIMFGGASWSSLLDGYNVVDTEVTGLGV